MEGTMRRREFIRFFGCSFLVCPCVALAEFIGLISGAASWPVAAKAQQSDVPVVGLLSTGHDLPTSKSMKDFFKGLSELSYVDGQNIKIEYRLAEDNYDRLPALADDLIRRRVAVIVAPTLKAALAAKAATTTIPIVFSVGVDPVGFRLVDSLSRPGGNATGMSMFTAELMAKRLGLLHEMVPMIATVGALINPLNPNAESQSKQIQDAARLIGLQVHVANASSKHEIEAASLSLAQTGAGAIVVMADPFFSSQGESLVALASERRLPVMGEWPAFADIGGLIGYGVKSEEIYRQIGVYTGRILKGEKPSDLPVIRPTKFELAINLKTANTLGIEVPATLLARADEVIE
jgi:putative ABC transport system substrate-binding protein